MNELLQMLRDIEGDTNLRHHEYLHDADNHAVDECACLAAEELITNNGGCNRTNMHLLKAAGFNVTPGEIDSFGWLTGCIHTTKGIIVYG